MNYEAVLFYKQQRTKEDVPQTATETGAEANSAEAAQKEKSDLVGNDIMLWGTPTCM